METNNVGGVYSPPSVNIPEDSIAVKEKSELTVNQNTVKYVIDNACFQQGAVIGKIQEDDYRSSLTHIIPVLFSGYDSKRTSAIIELCDALLLDAINQQKQRDSLEKQAIKQAGLLKDLKYKEADYQIAAAVVGAIVSGAVSVAGGSMAIKGLNPAASGGDDGKRYRRSGDNRFISSCRAALFPADRGNGNPGAGGCGSGSCFERNFDYQHVDP